MPTPRGKSVRQSLGSLTLRITYHYWFHIGEILAIRHMSRGRRLREYVGDLEQETPYRTETSVARRRKTTRSRAL